MHGFNDTSINWHDSASVFNHYDTMVKRYLRKANSTDFTKYELALHGHLPMFLRWEYPDIPKPCINRIKKLSNNSFEFDLEQTIEFINLNVNITRKQYIRIETSENEHFKSATNFKTPLFGYTVISTQPPTTSVRAPEIIRVLLNPLKVEKTQNKWFFFYNIFATKACKVNIRFRMTYVYYTSDDELAESSDGSPEVAVLSTNVNNDELPVVEESTLLKIDAFETESIEDPIEPSIRRSSSLRSSLRTVKAPSELKEEFKITEETPLNTKTATLPNIPSVFYQLDEKTIKRLNRKK